MGVKNIMKRRNISFNWGGVTRSRELQKHVKQELEPAKIRYKNKVQTQRSVGNSHPAWVGVISIIGIK